MSDEHSWMKTRYRWNLGFCNNPNNCPFKKQCARAMDFEQEEAYRKLPEEVRKNIRFYNNCWGNPRRGFSHCSWYTPKQNGFY